MPGGIVTPKMNTIFFRRFICLLAVISGIILNSGDVSGKNYSRRAPRPTTSDHTWSDFDYNFNLDEGGRLTGTNIFTLVYNTTPPRWYNDGYGIYRKICKTGSETLKITELPGDDIYRYTLTTNVTIWDWDEHLHKWAKRNPLPFNGTRTFIVKDGVVDGKFEFPITTNAFLDVTMIYGSAADGLIPSDGKVSWRFYGQNKPTENYDKEIVPEGDSIRISLCEYVTEVLKTHILGSMEESESGSLIRMAFPITNKETIELCGRDANVGSLLDNYLYIGLPDVYCNRYVNPYDPVTTILPNGHTQVTTLNPNQSKDIVETWTENGFNYKKELKNGIETPIRGTKTSNDTLFIHIIDNASNSSVEETGFKTKGKYYMTRLKDGKDLVEIDWSPFVSEGYYIISNNGNKYFAVDNKNSARHTFRGLTVESKFYKAEYGNFVFKIIDNSGAKTVSVENEPEMTPEAKEYIRFRTHPYIVNLFKETYSQNVSRNFTPPAISTITFLSNGAVERIRPKESLWGQFVYDLDNPGKNPLTKIAALIAMELDVPDYDVNKIDEKIVGKRTAKMMKKLCSLLKQKNNHKAEIKISAQGKTYQEIFPNNAKKHFTNSNRYIDYKKVEITRIVKKGGKMTVFLQTTDTQGKICDAKMTLEDNVPTDRYAKVWECVAHNI